MTALKDATLEKHKQAERMPFNVRMFNGQLSPQDYLNYLIQQLAIFEVIESKGLPHASLTRVAAVQADIDELVAKGYTLSEVLPSTFRYTSYIDQLNSVTNLPHVYLNYLAIMYGGQIMRQKVPSSGAMYAFDDMKSGMMAIRSVQRDDWATEVNKAYDFIIAIFDELETKVLANQN